MSKRITDLKGRSILVTKHHYPSKNFSYGWTDSSETFELYTSSNADGVEKTFLRTSKAWDHARS